MTEESAISYDESLKRKAYLEGLRLKNSGLEAEIIYARLEKQGIPDELARKVVKDIMAERKKENIKDAKSTYNIALIRISIGVLAAIISSILLPGHIIIPIGLITGGIVLAILSRRKTEE